MPNIAEVRAQFGGASYVPNLMAEQAPQGNSLGLGQRLSIFSEAVGNKGRAVALAAVLAACQSGSPATPSPTRIPDATPSPVPTLVVTPTLEITPAPVTPSPVITPEVTPSPVVTPTKTPEKTASPTPTETPVEIKSYVDELVAQAEQDGWPRIKASEVLESIQLALSSQPDLNSKIFGESNMTYPNILNKDWDMCQHGDPDFGGDPEENKVLGCSFVASELYQAYLTEKNTQFLAPINNVLAWAQKNLEPGSGDRVIEQLKSYYP